MIRALTAAVILTFSGASLAAAQGPDPIGYVKEVSGTARILSAAGPRQAALGGPVYPDDTLETGADGALGVLFIDDSKLSLGADTSLTIDEYVFVPNEEQGSFVSRLARGTLLYVSGLIAKLSPESARVDTSVGTIGIRGTRFLVRLEWADE